MRTISALFVTFVLVFTVDAGNPPPVTLNKCVGLIDEAKAKFDSLGNSFVSYSKSLNPSAYDKVNSVLFKPEDAYQKLQNDDKAVCIALDYVFRTCCPLPSDSVAKENDKSVSEAFKGYSLAAVGAFDVLKSKASTFDESGDPYKTIKNILYGVSMRTDYLHKCLHDSAPQAERMKIAEYTTRFDNSFEPVLNIFKVR